MGTKMVKIANCLIPVFYVGYFSFNQDLYKYLDCFEKEANREFVGNLANFKKQRATGVVNRHR